MEITYDFLTKLLAYAKSIKQDYVHFEHNLIIGCELNCITISEMVIDDDFPQISFIVKDLIDFMKVADKIDMYKIENRNSYSYIVNLINKKSFLINNRNIDTLLIRKYNDTINNIYDEKLVTNIILSDDEKFNTIMSGKVADGNFMININHFQVSIYSSLLPVNKGDVVTLELLNNPLLPTYLTRYIINKKKKNNIVKYVRLLKI